MRYSTTLLPLVAAAAAVVIPDEATAKQLVLEAEQQAEKTASSAWDNLPTSDDILLSGKDALDDTLDAAERQAGKLNSMLRKIEVDTESGISDFFSDLTSGYGGPHHHGPPHSTNLTIYQSIHASNYTTKFASLVDDYPDLVEKLNSTSAGNVTAFIPSDRAFKKHMAEFDHKPPKEFIEKIIQYHILAGLYPAGRVLAHNTLPTALEEEALGGRPQRLRIHLSLFGLKLNGYSKVIFANLFTKNGVVHGVDKIILPPPPVERLISLFPGKFSTLELAAEKTGFKHHRGHHSSGDDDNSHAEKLTGLTLFAPTNLAFKKLGPATNAFLFNTEKGLGYLRALLAYHVVANETLYSDEFYGKKKEDDQSFFVDGDNEEGVDSAGSKHYHLDLPTLLGDKHISVDISRWFGFTKIRLNGHIDVAIQDAVAKNGVVQVVDSVLIPPHPHHKKNWDDELDGRISVEELVERLGPYVEGHDAVEAGEL
ncbi:FAS1 domain-containing protein [Hypoxylon rubiginosum]|uniref:FAS1 domain-containing protein n=1 Tax=Hypoxylon rubiginosum TaxID=110542 RepID=A0ACB9YX26_9PEZI|nr:FAS1 domain-containing protein [Hypoxylon rubiginosum]